MSFAVDVAAVPAVAVTAAAAAAFAAVATAYWIALWRLRMLLVYLYSSRTLDGPRCAVDSSRRRS